MGKEQVAQFIKKFYTDAEIPKAWESDPKEAVRMSGIHISDEELAILEEAWNPWEAIRAEANARSYSQIDEASKNMRTAFNTTLAMHILTFSLGVVLIIVAIVAAFMDKGVFAAITGALGFIDIIVYFIKEPIRGVHESIGNLIQLQLAHQGWFNDLNYWQVFTGSYDIKTNKEVTECLQQYTVKTLQLIQDYCEKPLKINAELDKSLYQPTKCSGGSIKGKSVPTN